jgi:copper chaperone CopZ
MNTYVHHVPGRLRVRTAAVKRNPEAAALAKQSLSAVAGVLSAEANTVTGSVTLRYDPATISQHDIFDVLRRAGYAQGSLGQRGPAGPESVVNGYADVIAEKIGAFVVKKVLERSAVALIGALI